MSKYGDLIKEARKTEIPADKERETENLEIKEKNVSSILENKESDKSDDDKKSNEEKLAGISIKVPESLRRHWVVESKRTGKSMTSVIINALTEEFGKP